MLFAGIILLCLVNKCSAGERRRVNPAWRTVIPRIVHIGQNLEFRMHVTVEIVQRLGAAKSCRQHGTGDKHAVRIP